LKKNIDVARAWRDEDYYLNLTEEERASLGAHPAGKAADDVLTSITGGCGAGPYKTLETTVCATGQCF
jgi:mersacidin/lichenicidin family type 2 lantibiotic